MAGARKWLLLTMVCGVLSLAMAGADSSPVSATLDVQQADLIAQPVGANWTSYNGDYTGRRYSGLNQITIANIPQLRAQWVFHSPLPSVLEVTPAVVNGLMFVTAANDTFALDARTGRVIWHYSRPTSEGLIDDASQHVSRGVAIWHSRIFVETDNAHLLCLDGRSGHLLWEVAYAPQDNPNYGATSAPLVVGDRVVVGTSGGDDGVRGFLAAYDVRSGKLLWRVWTIPAPGEPGSSSWPGDAYLHGGGTTWMPGSFDPQLNTLYWATSNPSPDFDGNVRPGDDLYTDCVLALDPQTGKLKWYFQFTPHDLFDYDATETLVLVNAAYKGRPRQLLLQANRNGFVYVLDRASGQFLSAARFVDKLNWASGIDRDGRPIRTRTEPSVDGTRICPSYAGATNWFSPSYNPATGLLYFVAVEDCETYFSKPEHFSAGRTYYSTGVRRMPGEKSQKLLVAYDLANGDIRWKYPLLGDGYSASGTLTTAGNLVFFGDNAGSFEAVDAGNGAPLWHFNTGQSLHASPMTYAVNGKQFVAIAAGSDIFTFALP